VVEGERSVCVASRPKITSPMRSPRRPRDEVLGFTALAASRTVGLQVGLFHGAVRWRDHDSMPSSSRSSSFCGSVVAPSARATANHHEGRSTTGRSASRAAHPRRTGHLAGRGGVAPAQDGGTAHVLMAGPNQPGAARAGSTRGRRDGRKRTASSERNTRDRSILPAKKTGKKKKKKKKKNKKQPANDTE